MDKLKFRNKIDKYRNILPPVNQFWTFAVIRIKLGKLIFNPDKLNFALPVPTGELR